MSIVFGFLSAVLYGITDFVARFASQNVGVLRTMLYAQWLAAVVLTAAVAFIGLPQAPSEAWLLLLVSDGLILCATAFLYRALAIGRLIVVAPVTAAYGGVTAVLSTLSGEQLSVSGFVALTLLLAGAILVARPVDAVSNEGSAKASGLVPALCAACLYGAGFWLQGRYAIPRVGSLAAVWSYYALGSFLIPLVGAVRGESLAPPRGRDTLWVLAAGVGAVSAYLALAAGQHAGSVAITTMLSSLASAVTVLLGLFFLRERVALPGWAGMTLIIIGLVLLHT